MIRVQLIQIVNLFRLLNYCQIQFKSLNPVMLTRSKIKMEQSFKQIHENVPSFNNEPPAGYYIKSIRQVNSGNLTPSQAQLQQNTKFTTNRTEFNEESRPNITRNDILKQLRQEYEILRNISIEESEHVPLKQIQQKLNKYEEANSDLSSSMASKQSKSRGAHTPKQGNRQVEQLHLEKKQLELVIGNSMKKIEELLNNEITLKKTIHELKTQVEGKGGVSLEYEKTIRNMQKNQEELQNELARVRHENDKHVQKIKELSEKINSLELELEKKDMEVKQGFDEQRRFHELIRIEKDKYLNLEIQCRSLKMELEMVEKDKNNEINRLMKQCESKEGTSDRQMSYLVKKLENEIRDKDKRYHQLLLERERRTVRESEVISLEKKGDKNFLEQILERSKSINENSNKAITEGMNLIFAKMSELQKKSDDNLKKEIETIKRRMQEENRRKGSTEIVIVDKEREKQLMSRVIELESIIEKEIAEKNKLNSEIKSIEDHKEELEEKNSVFQRKIRELEVKEATLIEEIGELESLRSNYQTLLNECSSIKAENSVFIEKLKVYEKEHETQRTTSDSYHSMFREKEKKMEEEIRLLKRRVDEATFEAEKNRKEGEFNINIYKTSQQSELRRLNAENARLAVKLRETEDRLNKIEKDFETTVKGKDKELTEHRAALQSVRNKAQEDLISQKKFYEERISQVETRHTNELKAFNQKFIALSSTNEKLIGQLAHMGMLESEVLQLRRLLRNGKNTSAGIDHLWEVKEAEYENISQIIKTLTAA